MSIKLETAGKKIDDIKVVISTRIIELFSAGLYSSPNKAFEELICNSYDAFANKVSVYCPLDINIEDAYIWVCDNGEGLNEHELKDLWRIGVSSKRNDKNRDKKRLQIGQFGIGKLSTYILARKLTYLSKKSNKYIIATMDYNLINDDVEGIQIDEREVTEKEAKEIINEYCYEGLLNFNLFGKKAAKTWTFSLMTELKPKAAEIQHGRLKWLLSSALPLNPEFNLFFNGEIIESSKVNNPILKKWIIGKDDETVTRIEGAKEYSKKVNNKDLFFVDFPNLKGVNGEFILYEDSLVNGKSDGLGRSHGIFLNIRGRLINLDDPLLGMEAFSHGAFNRSRIIIHADALDNYLTSTREAVKESIPLFQLKEYIKKKFNNEVKKYYFDDEIQRNRTQSVSERLAQTSYAASKGPIKIFIEKFYNGMISHPYLIIQPELNEKDNLLEMYDGDLDINEQVIEKIEYKYFSFEEPVAKFNLASRILFINNAHPFITNYLDGANNHIPLESMIINEVLTEAYLYSREIEEETIYEIMSRRDRNFRQLAMTDSMGIPAAAIFLRDTLDNPVGLEKAVAKVLAVMGFEVEPIGGNGKPDGKAEAWLGFTDDGKNRNYSITYDAKSTGKDRIAAGTAHLSGLRRHRDDYKANYSLEVAIDYQGADDEESAISKEAENEKVTMMTAKDLVKLLLLMTPKQIGLDKLRDLFETCYKPKDVHEWIENLENQIIETPPYYELVDTIYQLQRTDNEPPEVGTIRMKLNDKLKTRYSKDQIQNWVKLLSNLVPGIVTIEGTIVGVQASADVIKTRIRKAVADIPLEIKPLYEEIFDK